MSSEVQVALRRADLGDVDRLVPWMHRFNEHEGIEIEPQAHRRALQRLLGDDSLGVVFIAERSAIAIGYAVVTYNFDLEFAGRDAFLTEASALDCKCTSAMPSASFETAGRSGHARLGRVMGDRVSHRRARGC